VDVALSGHAVVFRNAVCAACVSEGGCAAPMFISIAVVSRDANALDRKGIVLLAA